MILGLLVDRADHAYALKRRLSPGLPRERLINDGVLYPLLAKLEGAGLVGSTEQRGERGRTRRVYSVTRAGSAEFRRWLQSEEDEQGPPLHELFIAQPLVKLLFAAHLGPVGVREKLERHAERVAERISALETLQTIASPGATDGLSASLLELELQQLRDRLAWLRGVLQSAHPAEPSSDRRPS